MVGRAQDTFDMFPPIKGRGRGPLKTDEMNRYKNMLLVSDDTTYTLIVESQSSTPVDSDENITRHLMEQTSISSRSGLK